MATDDILHALGGKAANFLDLSGGASSEQIIEILNMMMTLPQIKVILINIFAGNFRCEKISDSFALYAKHLPITKPVYIRMHGSGSTEAKQKLKEIGSGMLHIVDDINVACEKAVEVAEIDELYDAL
jgi:succinyl-CoA synthetase beta subunit